jgi:hypothetical protein
VSVDAEDRVEEISFDRRGSIVPVFRGIRLLGHWKSARTRLADLGFDTPETDRNDDQIFQIARGLYGGSALEHSGIDSINVSPQRRVPRHSSRTPEEAALLGYSPRAHARVISVQMTDERNATVIVDTEPSRPVISTCQLWDDPPGWYERFFSGVGIWADSLQRAGGAEITRAP